MGDMDGTWELRGRARGLVVRTPGTAACEAGSLGLVDEVLDAEGGAHGVRDRLSVALARPVLHEREDGGRTRKHHAERDGCGGVADHEHGTITRRRTSFLYRGERRDRRDR